MNLRKTTGSAKLINRLYLFNGDSNENIKALSSSSPVNDQIMLCHLRLGHPTFQCHKYVFPTLFRDLNCSS